MFQSEQELFTGIELEPIEITRPSAQKIFYVVYAVMSGAFRGLVSIPVET
ncbi:MAG: hypothetical protein LBQ88_17500 [Treponema sp.]|nr:hypothetical protein [Treponema sp.]